MTLWETDSQIISETDSQTAFWADSQTVSELDSPIILEELEAILGDSEVERTRFAGLAGSKKGQRRFILGAGLAVSGLLLGWLVIGWWLWPVQWTNTSPWDLSPNHQRTFVDLVAKDYWQAGDLLTARQALAGWDDKALAELLATMQAQAPSFEARQRLAALTKALELPDYQASPFSSLLKQKAIILSVLLSISPLVLAMALVVSPIVREKAKQSDGLLGRIAGPFIEEATAEPGELPDQVGEYEGAIPGELPDQTEEEEEEAAAAAEATGAAPGEIEEEEEEEEEEEDDNWWEDDEQEDSDASVGDILTSLFAEEDTELPYLEALAKDLPEIVIGDLLQKGHQLADQLQKSNSLRAVVKR
jgi:hypothetical protein